MDDPEVDYESLFNDALHELEFALMVDGLPLNSNVDDAEFADTQSGMQIPEETNCLNFPDIHSQLFNFTIPLPIPEPDYIDNSLHPAWHQIGMMPTLTEDSPSATLNSSSVSEQSPGFSPAYSTSPLSINYSPREQLLPPTLGPTPTPTHDSSPKKKRQQRRQAKAERGNRPCDKRRADRKNNKKVQCVFCPKKVQDDRDLKRHYRAKHREEAAEMGIDMRRFPCTYCSGDFARDDHLKRHMGTQHGIE